MKEILRSLIVDDDAATSHATSRILKSAGYSVIQASSGADGLRAARKHLPDLVLLAVVMNDMSGVQVCLAPTPSVDKSP